MLQQHSTRPITTIIHGWLIKCPKRVLQSHAHNVLILQAKPRTKKLAEKAYFFGRMALWHQITRILSKPPPVLRPGSRLHKNLLHLLRRNPRADQNLFWKIQVE
jgi:hypothetical protein